MTTCSTCDSPATHEIVGADPSKGNKACEACLRRFWPLSEGRRLTAEERAQ